MLRPEEISGELPAVVRDGDNYLRAAVANMGAAAAVLDLLEATDDLLGDDELQRLSKMVGSIVLQADKVRQRLGDMSARVDPATSLVLIGSDTASEQSADEQPVSHVLPKPARFVAPPTPVKSIPAKVRDPTAADAAPTTTALGTPVEFDNQLPEQLTGQADKQNDDSTPPSRLEQALGQAPLQGRDIIRLIPEKLAKFLAAHQSAYKYEEITRVVIGDDRTITVNGGEQKLRALKNGEPNAVLLALNFALQQTIEQEVERFMLDDLVTAANHSPVSSGALYQALTRLYNAGLFIKGRDPKTQATTYALPKFLELTDERPPAAVANGGTPDFLAQ